MSQNSEWLHPGILVRLLTLPTVAKGNRDGERSSVRRTKKKKKKKKKKTQR
eukprot:NODE_16496_length_991_cov_5.504630.p6 GENE.NODE_16496_length_991_cov_5.504630~~NODE_16496_length_991_cov_5.504630.p6  ORF type:complete len:51 (-),score=21.29 NODE_16496_length_991_cov_5.504630:90-242(-)